MYRCESARAKCRADPGDGSVIYELIDENRKVLYRYKVKLKTENYVCQCRHGIQTPSGEGGWRISGRSIIKNIRWGN